MEHRYDPLVGTFTCSPSQNPAPVEENRQIIKMIKNLEPALSDSEALLLHAEQYKVGVPKGVVKWDSASQRWTEERMFEYYLKDGWLKALRENRLEEWRKQEKQKILSEHKEQKSQFFRGDSDRLGGDSGRLVSKTFYGHWHYKNHYYNKDQGLLGDAKRDTVNHCRARCLIRYTKGSNVYYSYPSPPNAGQLYLTYGSGSEIDHFRYWVSNDPFNPDITLRNWYWNTKQKTGQPDSVDADSIEDAKFKDGKYWVKLIAYDIKKNFDEESVKVTIANFRPRVKSATPTNGQGNVPLNQHINIKFSDRKQRAGKLHLDFCKHQAMIFRYLGI